MKNKVLVIGADHHNTLGIVESLGQKGLNSYVLIVGENINNFDTSPIGKRFFRSISYSSTRTSVDLRRMTPKAIRQITTDSSEPAAVASPIGRSVAGNNFEVT